MASSGSTRDLTKALHAFVAAPTLPPPDSLIRVIEAYLDKHAAYDQTTSDRLQEDLASTFAKSVQGRPLVHYAAFLAVLQHLRPALRSSAHVLMWWDNLVEPVLARLGDERGALGTVMSDIAQFLVPDDDDEGNDVGVAAASEVLRDSTAYTIGLRLLHMWMDVYATVLIDGYVPGWTKERPIQDVLVMFGKRKPREFFCVVNDFFVQQTYRARSIMLLSEFCRSDPPHLYRILKSPLFESLLRCLQHDTSTTVVSLALTCLTMILPNMPSSIVPYLPILFNIYARILFWDQEMRLADETGVARVEEPPRLPGRIAATAAIWEPCLYAADVDGPSPPHALGYFNVLYGLYPLNFMDYIRKPERYLRHANAKDVDGIEVQPSEIRDRSEPFRRCHALHPNFYNLTIDSEKTDFGRWMRSATADIVAECIALYVPTDEMRLLRSDAAMARRLALPGSPLALDGRLAASAGHAAEHATESAAADGATDDPTSEKQPADTAAKTSPALRPLLSVSTSHADLQHLVDANKAIRMGMYDPSVASDSVPSLSLSSHADSGPALGRSSAAQDAPGAMPSLAAEPQTPRHAHQAPQTGGDAKNDTKNGAVTEEGATLVAELRRQILLLKNDLGFERYMVQQHLAHIGALRHHGVRLAVTEAETQSLILAKRTLQQRLEEAKKKEAQIKREAEMSRNRAKNFEEAQSARLRVLRQEQRTWRATETALRRDLESAQDEGARLVAVVCAAEVRELQAKQDMQMLEGAVAEADRLRAEIKAHAAAQRAGLRRDAELAETRAALGRAENALMLLHTKQEMREDEFARARAYYEQQIAALNSRLSAVLRNGRAAAAAAAAAATRTTAETGAGEEGEAAGTPAKAADAADAADAVEEADGITSAQRAQVENVLAASRAKYLELVKNHAQLMRRVTVLESARLDQAVAATVAPSDAEMEMRAAFRAGSIGSVGSLASAGSGSAGAGPVMRPLRPRVVSDAGSYEAISPGTTWATPTPMGLGPAPAMTSPPAASGARRPSTPQGVAGPATTDRTSPQVERYYGRGGVQNSSRKDRKDKKPEETTGDKKDKKTGGSAIRVIRGFV